MPQRRGAFGSGTSTFERYGLPKGELDLDPSGEPMSACAVTPSDEALPELRAHHGRTAYWWQLGERAHHGHRRRPGRPRCGGRRTRHAVIRDDAAAPLVPRAAFPLHPSLDCRQPTAADVPFAERYARESTRSAPGRRSRGPASSPRRRRGRRGRGTARARSALRITRSCHHRASSGGVARLRGSPGSARRGSAQRGILPGRGTGHDPEDDPGNEAGEGIGHVPPLDAPPMPPPATVKT